MLNRRGFLIGLSAVIAAPAIVRPGLIMPIQPKLIIPTKIERGFFPIEGMAKENSGHGAQIATFDNDAWKISDFTGNASDAWERLKARHKAKFDEISEIYGSPFTGEKKYDA